ncbi:MAG: SRPBCC family protein [Chitinophagales bacterium]
MKYTCTVTIDVPIEKVVALWEDEQNFKEWQDDFKSIEHLEGIPHIRGAKSKIVFDGKNRIELIETILSIDLPKEKVALYEHIHMTNTQSSKFKTIEDNKTLYTSEVKYLKFNGFMVKLFAKFFPSKFKGQSQKWMNQFKAFAEQKMVL